MSPTSSTTSASSSSSGSNSTTSSWLVHGLLSGAAIVAAAGAYVAISTRRSAKFRSRVVGIIPARFGSSRFQGKPLVPILGKPMIQRTWERAKLATTLNKLFVATDDERIAEICQGFGADVIMTSESCRNGTERCSEALQKLRKKFDIVVNIQGDEPLIEPEIIDGVVKALQGLKKDAIHQGLPANRDSPVRKGGQFYMLVRGDVLCLYIENYSTHTRLSQGRTTVDDYRRGDRRNTKNESREQDFRVAEIRIYGMAGKEIALDS
ncbi:hypothetical protein SLA2020_407200 [Shorea laevis]